MLAGGMFEALEHGQLIVEDRLIFSSGERDSFAVAGCPLVDSTDQLFQRSEIN
jgi:hypothetical protein